MIKSKKRLLITGFTIMLLIFTLIGCSQTTSPGETTDKPTLVLADAGWDSIQFHNAVVQHILEEGYGYKTDILNGSTPITFAGLVEGDIDIYTEVWTTNLGDSYAEALENKEIFELSLNFGDNAQGLYVPTYMIKGDSARGIKATTPDLKSVKDLAKYWEVFKDAEDPSKGRIYGAIPGWAIDPILEEKITNYGLKEYYNYFSPGSDTALSASMVKAYESGKPWVGYYWEPTWIMGKMDMTLLTDEPYSDELWNNGYQCTIPPVPVTVCVDKETMEKAPEVVAFLKNYKTSSALTSEALAYIEDSGATMEEAAKWFLKEKQDLWLKWVPEDIAEKVNKTL